MTRGRCSSGDCLLVTVYCSLRGFAANGAIAQLGERVLCKHEVVGSIPSGSTRRRDRRTSEAPSKSSFARCIAQTSLAALRDFRHREEKIHPVALSRVSIRQPVCSKEEISWKGHLRETSERTSICGRSLTATSPGVFEAKVFLEGQCQGGVARRPYRCRNSAEGLDVARWALKMRAIKCLKGIRWMPWR